MAGAGYKLFNTGDVLTAAQVNTYLQEQTVMVFASAAARTTALTGVVAEGMISYLTDTDVVQYYNGTTWTTINTDQTPLTTKGDLFTFSTQDARLAVGNPGETLVADSSATTGLRWQGNYAAGKNKIINGDFGIWQRGTSGFALGGAYNSDRWTFYTGTSTNKTVTQQTFTPGTAPVVGNEGRFFWQFAESVATVADANVLSQRIEDVRTFAAQTITISFYAKSTNNTSTIGVSILQNFGSGGSGSVSTGGSTNTLTTSYQRYTSTISVPSISGKTIGTSSFLEVNFGFSTNKIQTIDIWGVQVEAGSVATAFQTATGTLAGEFAAACRYFYRLASGTDKMIFIGSYTSSSNYEGIVFLPVPMRTAPTLSAASGTNYYSNRNSDTFNSLSAFFATPQTVALSNDAQVSGTQGQAYMTFTNNASTTVDFSAEL